ncbi:hypothetical protein D3C86_1855410 [compost metagenome]
MWHELSCAGTPSFALMAMTSLEVTTLVRMPASFRCWTQASQQPQFGSLYTTKDGDAACAVTPMASNAAMKRSFVIKSDS